MDFFEIGEVAKPQGLNGEIKIKLHNPNTTKLSAAKHIFLDDEEYNITAKRMNGDFAYIKLEGINSIEQAEKYRAKHVKLLRTEKDILPEGEYYVCDLIGTKVYNSSNVLLGTLNDIFQHGSADIYRVCGDKNFSFPALNRVIKSINIAKKEMFLDENMLFEVAIYDD